MKINRVLLLIATAVVVLTINSCKKTDNSTTQPTNLVGELYLNIEANMNTTVIDSGIVAHDSAGRRIQCNLAQFYISGIKFKKADGTYYTPTPSVYLLHKMSNITYFINTVPAEDYLSVSFNVGIDSATNTKNPSTFISSSPLYLQQPSMWFGSTFQGYIFLNANGLVDTSANNNGTVNYPFTLQLGTNAELMNITMPDRPFTVLAGTSQYVNIIADYGKLFSGISFLTFNVSNNWNISPSTSPA